ncbi:hypothetical protein QJS10_CPB14g00354 [Acorus calamus]|uniref:UspA domain-containing protein n=1 Tax=Acorus calamus TaxID=4465 RepID=A0AAV9DE01_ACOCL|nr:hypothetical protein QJS10_CPB14g00354 [Acorus calamus]
MATEKEKKRVMVAIDESECSHHALEWALDNLRESISSSASASDEDRLLTIYTAQPLTNLLYFTESPELIESIEQQQKKVSMAVLKRAKETCAKRGVV